MSVPIDGSGRREPPAFQEYAADMLASPIVRQMNLDEIGLLCKGHILIES